jgi:NADP-dependent 3-hydroxy acid dehydrogenase YdfG
MAGPQFQDQVALVTGAAGDIGGAVVCRLLGEGARVALVDVNRSELEAMAEQLGKHAGRVLAAPADVTREADVADYSVAPSTTSAEQTCFSTTLEWKLGLQLSPIPTQPISTV